MAKAKDPDQIGETLKALEDQPPEKSKEEEEEEEEKAKKKKRKKKKKFVNPAPAIPPTKILGPF